MVTPTRRECVLKTKGYRVIRLLSCLGKVVEKVAAKAISIDAVACLI